MTAKRDWEPLIRRMEQLLRLKSFPVAFKMLEKKEMLADIPFLRRLGHKATLCQMINLVRNFDWTVGADADGLMGPVCPTIVGLADAPEFLEDGTFRSIVWVKNRKDGKKYESSIPRIPTGKYEAVAMAPAVYNPFEPDMVLIYANPAQMMLLINALQFEAYEVMDFHCVGESSCSDVIARCHLTGKPSLSIPCYGERRYGHAQDEDLAMAIPADMMEKALKGLEILYRKGVRYPISFAGAERDAASSFPAAYGEMDQLKHIRGTDNRLLLGVTGCIASGKSTVAAMLEELGAPIIDFDVLSRLVVEPEKPAWKEIVAYFGEQVLLNDGNLDRKKLGTIIFRDFEKRKKLESFIHPRVNDEFMRQLEEITSKNPDAIVQAVVPLLIELNMQYLFHKILLVSAPYEKQVERLAIRDEISKEEAANRLSTQLPIEEKAGFADYVIDNSGPVEQTRKKVEDLWETLQADRRALRGI